MAASKTGVIRGRLAGFYGAGASTRQQNEIEVEVLSVFRISERKLLSE
jgi:hypothetical protein